ncbi:hypothetical protein V6N13_036629 [Hibiscus sabdariffa]|uniref:Uncharacterized protein n=1 Tax=Hibiscus sabdariffa TaxID=183260 RepID=A0ABR2S691_9ROSI
MGLPSSRFHGSFGVSNDCLVVVLEGVGFSLTVSQISSLSEFSEHSCFKDPDFFILCLPGDCWCLTPDLFVQLFFSGFPCSWCLILVVYRACWLIVELLGVVPVPFSYIVMSYCLWVTYDIAIVSWNVKGLGKFETIWTSKFLIDKHRPSVIFLSETKQHGSI